MVLRYGLMKENEQCMWTFEHRRSLCRESGLCGRSSVASLADFPTSSPQNCDNVARSVKHNRRKYGNYFQNCQTTAAQLLSCDAYHVLKSIQLHCTFGKNNMTPTTWLTGRYNATMLLTYEKLSMNQWIPSLLISNRSIISDDYFSFTTSTLLIG